MDPRPVRSTLLLALAVAAVTFLAGVGVGSGGPTFTAVSGRLLLLVQTPTSTSTPTPTSTSTPTSTPTPQPTATPTIVPTPTPLAALACDAAVSAVEQRHATLFALMTSLDVSLQCGRALANGKRAVAVSWRWHGQPRSATYVVARDGTVAPGDTNAARLDAVARYGPLALSLLGL